PPAANSAPTEETRVSRTPSTRKSHHPSTKQRTLPASSYIFPVIIPQQEQQSGQPQQLDQKGHFADGPLAKDDCRHTNKEENNFQDPKYLIHCPSPPILSRSLAV